MKEDIIFNNEKIKVKKANTFISKLIGLSFKKNINYGLFFYNTNGIHTFFMRENIDVILLDKDFNILYNYNSLKPWKVLLPKKNVKHTLELPNNYAKYFE